MLNRHIQRDQAAHGMAEKYDRQPGMRADREFSHRDDVGDNLGIAVLARKKPKGCVCRRGLAMAAMVMGIDVIAMRGQRFGK